VLSTRDVELLEEPRHHNLRARFYRHNLTASARLCVYLSFNLWSQQPHHPLKPSHPLLQNAPPLCTPARGVAASAIIIHGIRCGVLCIRRLRLVPGASRVLLRACLSAKLQLKRICVLLGCHDGSRSTGDERIQARFPRGTIRTNL
jgi:hypothetical protein